MNPYQQPAQDGASSRKGDSDLRARSTGVPPESLRVALGLVVILGATLGFVVGSAALALVDRFEPVSWFVFSATAVGVLIGVFLVAAAALGWLSWTLQKKGYPRRRLSWIAGLGWFAGLLCLVAIVRADTLSQEAEADAVCAPLRAQRGVLGSTPPGESADRCKASFLRCRRKLRRQPGFTELTFDAERAMMNDCMSSPGAPR